MLSLRYIKEQVSKTGINVHKSVQAHFPMNKEGFLWSYGKYAFLFYLVANDYLQFRIMNKFVSAKSQGIYLHYIGQRNSTEHIMCITHNCQDESKMERKHRAASNNANSAFKASPISKSRNYSCRRTSFVSRPALFFAPAPRPPVTALTFTSQQLRKS